MKTLATTFIFCLLTILSVGQTRILSKKKIGTNSDSISIYSITYNSDSYIIDGFLLEPKEIKCPVLIFNRGGNREFGRLTVELINDWLIPIAKAGYTVIASQYRLNDEFGGSEINDVLNLIDLVTELPNVDTSRIGMYGWSRGGMMTYLTLAKTCRIKTAIIGGAPTNLVDLIEQRPVMDSLFAELIPNYNTNKTEALKSRSVFYWPDKLCKTTSLLLIHGKKDKRVSYTQATNLEKKLKQHNRPVKTVIFDSSDHIITQNREKKDELIISWLRDNL